MRYSLILTAFLASTVPASADDWAPPVSDRLVQKECGSCHMTFQPAFLPKRSWDKIMDTLPDHFGDDASLPADQAVLVRAYLAENAGDIKRRGLARKYMHWVADDGIPLKITENPAFLREHNFPDRVWKNPKVVVKSNCPACHLQANRGEYEDN